MKRWKLQDAKAKFSELVDTSLRDGPQVVTRRGKEAAVLVSFEDWRRLQHAARPSIKSLLLDVGPRFDDIVPRRGRFLRRQPQ